MSAWFYDRGHVVLPVVRHRLCVDYFLSYSGYTFTAITFLVATAATVLGAGISNYFLSSALIALAMLPWASYGEWAISAREAGHVYTYIVGLTWLCFSLIWSGAAGYIHVRQGKEAIEEGWYTLQTQVLPFTTQLDFKNQLESMANIIFGLSLTSGLASLLGVVEGWQALGGQLVLVNSKWAWALPEAVTVIVLAGGSASYAIYGASVAAWATTGSAGVQALAWHGSISLLVVLVGAAQLGLPATWGVTFLTHAILALVSALPAFILLVTSLVLQSTALGVDGFVQPRWKELQQFVPEKYQGLPWDKYAEACYTPMQEAAMTGIILSVVLLFSALYHWQTAGLLWSVGPQLAVARARLQAQHARILNITTAALPAAIATASAPGPPPGVPVDSDSMSGDDGAVAVKDWAGSGGSGAAGKGKAGWAPVPIAPLREASRYGVTTLLKGTDAAATALSSAVSSARGYGAVSTSSVSAEDPLAVPLNGGSSSREDGAGSSSDRAGGVKTVDLRQAEGYQAPSAGDGVHKRATVAASASSSGGSSGSTGEPTALTMPTNYPGGAVAAAEARARVAAMQQYQLMLMTYEKSVGAIGKKATMPDTRQWLETFRAESMATARPFASCLFVTGWMLLASIVAISVGVSQVTTGAQCGVLAYAPAVSYYNTSIQLESGPGGYAKVLIDHRFPYGSIQIDADHASGVTDPLSDEVIIELTAYAARGSFLPSFDTLAAYVNVSTDCVAPADDDTGGCLGVQLILTPGVSWSDAQNQCLGLRLRLITSVQALFFDVSSQRAMVNVSGNSVEFVDGILNGDGSIVPVPSTMQALAIRTDTATIAGVGVYAARYFEFPPNLTPSLTINSNKGNIFLKNTVAQALTITTGGNIQAATLISGSPSCGGICGDVALTTTGKGSITMAQLFAAYSAKVTTENGAITVVNSGADVALDLEYTSKTGPVTLANLIQLHGNNTIVRTSGTVSVSAAFCNVLDVQTTGSSKVTMYEVFLGLGEPVNAAGDLPFNPVFGPGQNYSYPALIIRTERGDVQATGVGGDPRDGTNSLTDSVIITSISGDIKVEVSGSGVNANYTVGSVNGRALVEVDGLLQPAAGQLGVGSDPVARNFISLYTVNGDVQMSELPSPL